MISENTETMIFYAFLAYFVLLKDLIYYEMVQRNFYSPLKTIIRLVRAPSSTCLLFIHAADCRSPHNVNE